MINHYALEFSELRKCPVSTLPLFSVLPWGESLKAEPFFGLNQTPGLFVHLNHAAVLVRGVLQIQYNDEHTVRLDSPQHCVKTSKTHFYNHTKRCRYVGRWQTKNWSKTDIYQILVTFKNKNTESLRISTKIIVFLRTCVLEIILEPENTQKKPKTSTKCTYISPNAT